MVWGAELQRSEHFCAQLESAFELTIITFIYTYTARARDVCVWEGGGGWDAGPLLSQAVWRVLVAGMSPLSLSLTPAAAACSRLNQHLAALDAAE
jgi:hypothetical protein